MRFSTLAMVLAVALLGFGCGSESNPTAPSAPTESWDIPISDVTFTSCSGVDAPIVDGVNIAPNALAGFRVGFTTGAGGNSLMMKISFLRSDGTVYVDETLTFGPIQVVTLADYGRARSQDVRFRVSDGLLSFAKAGSDQAISVIVTFRGHKDQVYRAPFRFYVGS